MLKKIVSILLLLCLLIPMGGCAETVPEGNVAFESLEEMQECLNGKWFSIDYIFAEYTEIVFNNNEIKKCRVLGWDSENDVNEQGEVIGTKYELKHYENLEFTDYFRTESEPQLKYQTGQVLFDNISHIDIKEYITFVEEKEITEKYLLIDGRKFLKATNNTDLSTDNFKIFEKFCEKAIYNKAPNPFNQMTHLGYEGLNGQFFIYAGCDSDKISFEIEIGNTKYVARTDEFGSLFNEVENIGLYGRTNIIGLIGTDMPDFEKKDWAKNWTFRELDYYLYMNSEGKLITNIK